MQRKKKKDGLGFYIAICCAVLVVAASGFVSRLSMEDKEDLAKVENPQIVSEETAKPVKTPTPAEEPLVVSNNVEVEENISFTPPVAGKVIEGFSGEDLIYNEALKDWRAHSGVDFEAKMGEKVLASANGIVEDVFDSNMGRCVVIDHKNGYRTMYANLDENTAVKKGEEVAQGDVIGAVGDTALGDITNVPHVHFEVMDKEGNLNPAEYLE